MNANPILQQPPGTFVLRMDGTRLRLMFREDPFRADRYPRQCTVEVRLGVWDQDGVVLVALLLRVNRNDLTTFQRWINALSPADARFLMALSRQPEIEVHVVSETGSRVLSAPNKLTQTAESILANARTHAPWTPQQFDQARSRMDQFYPTAHALWWKA